MANTSQEITSRLTARAYAAIHDPQLGPQLREVMLELLFILDETVGQGFRGGYSPRVRFLVAQ